jgi:starch synthase
VPIVRATGGLADTVTDTTRETLESGKATGFVFREQEVLALTETMRRAVEAYQQPAVWSTIVANGMRQDWSWGRSAREYIRLYENTIARVRKPAMASG